MIQRRAVAGIVFAATLLMLAGCGFDSPDVEASEHASVQAADFTVGPVHVGDVFVTSTSSASNTPVNLVATLINDSQQPMSLTSVSTPLGAVTLSGSGVAAAVTGSALTLAPKGVLTDVGTASTGTTITIAAATPPAVGTFVAVKFGFSNGLSSSVVQVPVVPPDETTNATQPVPTATASVPSPSGVSASD